jgi:hypothetical protein
MEGEGRGRRGGVSVVEREAWWLMRRESCQVSILKSLQHENIVLLKDVFYDFPSGADGPAERLRLVLEFVR